jgi:metal-dependent amidase/aminoacylase/carboxypeptidase family protein
VKGVGGHGAYPHQAKDPIVLASSIVMRLQTLVSREQNPVDPAVVTVGSFHGGTKHNIISDEAKLELTVRSFSDTDRQRLIDGIRRIAAGEAAAAGMPADRMPVVTVKEPNTRATFNTPDFARDIAGDLTARMGEGRVVVLDQPVMGGEDFDEYRRADAEHIRSAMVWIGGTPAAAIETARREGKQLPSLHSPFWAPEADKVIASGAEALTLTALRLLKP